MKCLEIADLFCGAGGTSTGAVEAIEALGYSARLTAVDHWAVAIATHTANHPGARHLCTSIDDVKPQSLFAPGQLEVLWASPECTHHSVARGGKPINDQSRATAWCVVRWAEALRPNVILVENVPEFESWGGIGADGRPLHRKKGATFLAWVSAIESLGYTVSWRVLCAADYGDPTTRRRLFVQCVRGRRKIVWPDATHTKFEGSRLKSWVPARDIIDWAIAGQSIYERKRPLSPKTMRRIMAGLEKFGLKPFMATTSHGNSGKKNAANWNVHDLSKPLGSVTSASEKCLVEPYILTMEHGGGVRSADRPLPTITTAKGGAMAVVRPYIVRMHGTSTATDIGKPLGAVEAGPVKHMLAQPFLIPQHSSNAARSVEKPAPTVTTSSRGVGLAQPFLIHAAHSGDRRSRSVAEPLPTVAGNRGDVALCEPSLLPQHQGGALRSVSEPTPTVATAGAIGLVEPFLVEYYGTGGAESLDHPLNTVTTKERHALVRPVVMIDGERYLLDIRFRMLQAKELAAAQGFRRDYQFTGTKTEQVKQIGNAVPRNLARALVLAALSQKSDIRPFLLREGAA